MACHLMLSRAASSSRFLPWTGLGSLDTSARRSRFEIEKMSDKELDEDMEGCTTEKDKRRRQSSKADESEEDMQVDYVKEERVLEIPEAERHSEPRIEVKVSLQNGETISAASHQPSTTAADVFHTLMFAYGRGELISDDDGFGIPYSLGPMPAGTYTYRVTVPPGTCYSVLLTMSAAHQGRCQFKREV